MKVYFASDIHLGGGGSLEARERERRFVAWLDTLTDADAVVLVGDVFDFWFEYKRVVPKGFVRTLGRLAALRDRGVRVIFFTGNHDMWVRNYFAEECGMEVYLNPCVLEFGQRRLFVAHGDNMNIHDKPVLRLMNATFRSRPLRWLFRWLVHPDCALKFGLWWSGSSRKSHNKEQFTEAITEPLIDYARTWQATHPDQRIDHFVFGHMHFPRDWHEPQLHVVHLGGWELYPSYAVLDEDGGLTLNLLQK